MEPEILGLCAKFPELAVSSRKRCAANCRRAGTKGFLISLPIPKGWRRGPHPAKCSTIAPKLPTLIGGSADLNPSTFTVLQTWAILKVPRECSDSQGSAGGGWSYAGRNLHFGVREHGMAAR